jgi:hypothetical protein
LSEQSLSSLVEVLGGVRVQLSLHSSSQLQR